MRTTFDDRLDTFKAKLKEALDHGLLIQRDIMLEDPGAMEYIPRYRSELVDVVVDLTRVSQRLNGS